MKVSKDGATLEEVKELQAHARSTADTLRFEYCYKIHGLNTYSYCYSIDVHQENVISKGK